MRTKKFAFQAFALIVVLATLLAACGGAAEAPAAEAPAAEAPAAEAPAAEAPAATEAPVVADPLAELYEAAKAEGMLTTIALPHDWCNYGGVIEGFKAKYPGIEVNELDPGAGSGEEVEAIKANKDNPGPQAPDVIDVGLAFGPTSKAEGVIQPYKVSTWDDIPDSAKEIGRAHV